MKILKMLASDSEHFNIYIVFKEWQIGTGCAPADILNTTFSLITSVSNNLLSLKFTWLCYLTQEIQK